MSDYRLRLERVFQAARQTVFDTWTSSAALPQWHCGTVAEVIMELHEGGQFLIRFAPDENTDGACVRGRYLEVRRPERLRYTWKWDGADEESIVTIDFFEIDSTSTRMVVLQERLASEDSKNQHLFGWEACLNGLNDFLKSSVH